MNAVNKLVSALLVCICVFFVLNIVWVQIENFTNLRLDSFGSRTILLWTKLVISLAGGIYYWRRLSARTTETGTDLSASLAGMAEAQRRRTFSDRYVATRADLPRAAAETDANHQLFELGPQDDAEVKSLLTPEEIDMAKATDVAWVKAQRDPALWHEAAMAALAYRGDEHGFLPWLLAQPETDRATAGWIFLWAEGSRYLRGETDFSLYHLASDEMVDIFAAICMRSEGVGFNNDNIGLESGFEPERKACLDIIENGKLAAGIIAPTAIIGRPFDKPRNDGRFALDDGIILL